MQRAYEALLNEGVIYARRGKGYFVANLPDKDRTALASQRFHAQLEKLLASARQDGLSEAEIKQLFGKAMKAGE